MRRLPDLPNAGYSTRREKELSDAVMFFLRDTERDRKLLLMMVIEGAEVFIPRYMKEHRFLRIDEDLARAVFGYLVQLAGPNPQQQLADLLTIRPVQIPQAS